VRILGEAGPFLGGRPPVSRAGHARASLVRFHNLRQSLSPIALGRTRASRPLFGPLSFEILGGEAACS